MRDDCGKTSAILSESKQVQPQSSRLAFSTKLKIYNGSKGQSVCFMGKYRSSWIMDITEMEATCFGRFRPNEGNMSQKLLKHIQNYLYADGRQYIEAFNRVRDYSPS